MKAAAASKPQDLVKACLVAVAGGTSLRVTTTQLAPTIQRSDPLMQFPPRVDGCSAYVRVQPRRLEWSLVGREWVIQMAPIASVPATTSEAGSLRSSLIVVTIVGT